MKSGSTLVSSALPLFSNERKIMYKGDHDKLVASVEEALEKYQAGNTSVESFMETSEQLSKALRTLLRYHKQLWDETATVAEVAMKEAEAHFEWVRVAAIVGNEKAERLLAEAITLDPRLETTYEEAVCFLCGRKIYRQKMLSYERGWLHATTLDNTLSTDKFPSHLGQPKLQS